MGKQSPEIREEIPELRPGPESSVSLVLDAMTPGELDRYSEAVRRHKPVQRAVDSAESLWTGAFVITTAVVGFMVAWMGLEPVRSAGAPSLLRLVVWYTVPAATALVILIMGARADRRRRANVVRARRIEVLRAAVFDDHRACAECRYDLTGVGPADGRLGAARCPECGLVNPVAREEQRIAVSERG